MKAYYIKYRMTRESEVRGFEVHARSKAEAFDKAVNDEIPMRHTYSPYSLWVASVTYNNGNYVAFDADEE